MLSFNLDNNNFSNLSNQILCKENQLARSYPTIAAITLPAVALAYVISNNLYRVTRIIKDLIMIPIHLLEMLFSWNFKAKDIVSDFENLINDAMQLPINVLASLTPVFTEFFKVRKEERDRELLQPSGLYWQ